MVNTRRLISNVLDKSELMEQEYLDQIDRLEDEIIEDDYKEKIDNKSFDNIDSLIDYYNSLKKPLDKKSFEKLVYSVLKDEQEVNKFYEELKNISLLRRTGLLKYAKEQGNYSRNILDKFTKKIKYPKLSTKEKKQKEVEAIESKLREIRSFKYFLSPIGIVKEIEDPEKYSNYLDTIKLSPEEKKEMLLLGLDFNMALHDQNLNEYESTIQNKKDVINKTLFVKEKVVENVQDNEVETIVKDIEEKDRRNRANNILKTKKEEPKHDLFVEYYDILLDKKEIDDSEDIININNAKNYFKRNKHLIQNLSDIDILDLETTMNIYKETEDLRTEVYRTTEKVDRLLTYELKTILDKFDINEPDNIKTISNEVKPIMNYVETLEKEEKKKK